MSLTPETRSTTAARSTAPARSTAARSTALRARVLAIAGVLALAAALPGCFFNGSVARSAQIVCASDDDCPSGTFCARGRCAAPGVDLVAPAVGDVTLVTSLDGIPTAALLVGGQAQLEIEVVEDGLPAVSVDAVGDDGAGESFAFENVGGIDGVFTFRLDFSPAMASGAYGLVAALEDDADNSSVVEIDVELPVAPFEPSACLARHADGRPACTDADGDGVDGASAACPGARDCDDTSPTTLPGVPDMPGDDLDDGCKGAPLPLDEAAAVFAAPPPVGLDGALADGSRTAPFADLAAALARAAEQGVPLLMQAGRFTLSDDVYATTSIFGGYGPAWDAGFGESEIFVDESNAVVVEVTATPLPVRIDRVLLTGAYCDGIRAVSSDAPFFVTNTRFQIVESPPTCDSGLVIALNVDQPLYAAALDVAADVDNGRFHLAVHAGNARGTARIVASRIDMEAGSGIAHAFEAHGAIAIIRSDIVVRGSSAVAVDAHITGIGQVSIVGSSLVAESRSSASPLPVVIFPTSLTLVHSTIRAVSSPSDPEVIAFAGPDAAVLASVIDTGAATTGRAFVVDLAISLVDTAIKAPCLTSDGASECIAPQGDLAAQCDALSQCLEAVGSFATGDLGLVGETHHLEPDSALIGRAGAMLDRGAPSSIAQDLDGDCRAAVGVEPGADELP